jgi:hypothetical protein
MRHQVGLKLLSTVRRPDSRVGVRIQAQQGWCFICRLRRDRDPGFTAEPVSFMPCCAVQGRTTFLDQPSLVMVIGTPSRASPKTSPVTLARQPKAHLATAHPCSSPSAPRKAASPRFSAEISDSLEPTTSGPYRFYHFGLRPRRTPSAFAYRCNPPSNRG